MYTIKFDFIFIERDRERSQDKRTFEVVIKS